MDISIHDLLPMVIGLLLGTFVLYFGVKHIYTPLYSALIVALGGFILAYTLNHLMGFESRIDYYLKIAAWIVFVGLLPLLRFFFARNRVFNTFE